MMLPNACAVSDRPRDVALGETHSLCERFAVGTICRDGGGVRATCAVCRDAADEWGAKEQFGLPIVKNVERFLGARQVASFEENSAAELRVQLPRALAQLLRIIHAHAGERLGL